MIMGGVALALLLGIGVLAMRSGSSSEMGFLYTDLDPSAAAAISEKLKAQNVPFQLSADGTAITAPVDKLPELRMAMASEKLGGKIGYEVLDAEEPFGVSSSRAKMNETRAVEGELAKSIESLDRVSKARVHIVMPERAMFAAEARKATAAVTLKTQGRLPSEAVQSIRYLVSSSVPELSPESVSVVDQSGALLARAGDEAGAAASEIEERQAAVEGRLRQEIESLIEPIVGQGKVRAEVAVVLNRDQTRQEAEMFDPDKQVIQHQVTVESNDQNNESDAGAQGATVAAQLPDKEADVNGNGGNSRRSAKNESSEDTTYDNSRTHTVSVSGPGKINRLTVAVMVDGGTAGLPAPQVQRLTRLVENAVGFDADRGDSVVVESMPFAAVDGMDGEKSALPFGLTGGNLLNLVELIVVVAAGLFAVRMLRRRGTDAEPGTREGELTVEGREGEMLVDADGNPMLEGQGDPDLLDQEIALAQVDGRIRLSALRKIGDAISANPAESVSVIRQWMNA
ncbi:flagellar basal-body MS-ring/collar protein FliF [Sphingomonas quercus]|uniref:Flagellar M-ring protein n=1 Tax=Sphingomonas quercus TaxID=2842451 RepID=A0ABS6BK54_9SPHN|nr:flagellar basal-body MS-ring/collar protein FliF [Sphingomonas quercus]MBU3078677.1 flagellar M-ring protein FliF [Sphingomonas quercus]